MAKNEPTDIQRTVLAAAAAREGGYVWPVPEELALRKGSAALVVRAMLIKGLAKERRARPGELVWREHGDGKPVTVIVTRAGLAAVSGVGIVADRPTRTPRAGTKLAMLIGLLAREEGATVPEMAIVVGWQAHTVRGVMSGVLVKKVGLAIVSEKSERRGRVYRAVRTASSDDR